MIKLAHEFPLFMELAGNPKDTNDFSIAYMSEFGNSYKYFMLQAERLTKGHTVVLNSQGLVWDDVVNKVNHLAMNSINCKDNLILMLPYVEDDSRATLAIMTKAIEYHNEYELPCKLMVQIQARDSVEFLQAYEYAHKKVDYIGLASYVGREDLVAMLNANGILHQNLFLFGINEVAELAQYPDHLKAHVYGAVASDPVVCALMGIKYDARWGHKDPIREMDIAEILYLTKDDVSIKMNQLIRHNCQSYRNLNGLKRLPKGMY